MSGKQRLLQVDRESVYSPPRQFRPSPTEKDNNNFKKRLEAIKIGDKERITVRNERLSGTAERVIAFTLKELRGMSIGVIIVIILKLEKKNGGGGERQHWVLFQSRVTGTAAFD